MDLNRQVGLIVLGGSTSGVVLLHLLMRLFPDTWGGPNIGAGLLLLVGYVGMAIGLVILLSSRRARLQEQDAGKRRS